METETIDIAKTEADARPATQGAGRSARADRLLVRDSETAHVVRVPDVEWIDACGNYIEVHANGKNYLQRGTLKGIEERLPSNRFAKIHRSLIVNVRKVRELRRDADGHCCMVMTSGVKLRAQRPVCEIRNAILSACSV